MYQIDRHHIVSGSIVCFYMFYWWVKPSDITLTLTPPALISSLPHAQTVEPVVTTSSTMSTWRPATLSGRVSRKAPSTFSTR